MTAQTDAFSDNENASDAVASGGPTTDKLLRVENLRTWYETRAGLIRAVDGVSLSILRSRTLGLVGETGCGKSQTALSIMRLVEPPGRIQPGSRILFDGRDLTRLRARELEDVRGRDISMVFQDPMSALNPTTSIGDQIAETVRRHVGASRREAWERAVEILRLVGIAAADERVRSYPHELSGGMRQRVTIGIALACEPKLLIADEPTTALDVTIQAQVLDLLKALRDRLGMAMLIITHDLGVIAEMADDVCVMYAGRVVEQGPTREVLDHPQHPYTRALLQSVPVIGMTHAERLRMIPGTVPSPLDPPRGCRFQSRCEAAFERCTEEPPLVAVGRGRSRCWLAQGGESLEGAKR